MPTLGKAARQRVRAFGLAMPAWTMVLVLVVGAAAAGVIAARASNPPAPSTPAVSAVTSSASSSLSQPAASSAQPLALIDRAREGELIALKQLEEHPCADRPLEETIALASGHAVLKRADLAALVRDIQTNPHLLDDVNTVRLLHDHASDAEVAVHALDAIARFGHPVAPDLLFDIWDEGRNTASRELADDLIHHRSVRARATPELELVLALRETKNCRKLRGLLPSALEHADRRALTTLQGLDRKIGCGPKQEEDCYPCLRDPSVERQLRDAITKARTTPAPTRWRSRKVQDF